MFGGNKVQYLANFFGIGATELLIILVIVLLLFGGKKIPELFRNAGASVRELKKGMSEGESDKPKAQASTDTTNK